MGSVEQFLLNLATYLSFYASSHILIPLQQPSITSRMTKKPLSQTKPKPKNSSENIFQCSRTEPELKKNLFIALNQNLIQISAQTKCTEFYLSDLIIHGPFFCLFLHGVFSLQVIVMACREVEMGKVRPNEGGMLAGSRRATLYCSLQPVEVMPPSPNLGSTPLLCFPQRKCEQYWPSAEETLQFGPFSVTQVRWLNVSRQPSSGVRRSAHCVSFIITVQHVPGSITHR